MCKKIGWLLICLGVLTQCATSTPDLFEAYEINRKASVSLNAGQPRSLDPALAHSSAGGIIGHIFSGLVALDTTLQVQPELALGWDLSDDGQTYTFFLHPNARFHNGDPVTAQDVVFSWERALAPDTGSDTAATYLGDIVGAEALVAGTTNELRGVRIVDDKTVAVTIDAPKPYFLAKLTFPVAYIVDQNNVSQSDWEYTPNGSGPFMLRVWEDDAIIILDRNPDYYRESQNVEHVVYQLGAGLSLAMYEQGEIDVTGIGGSNLARAQEEGGELSADLRATPSLCTTFIGVNTRIPPFDDARVRQAFNYALDKQKLSTGLFSGNITPARGILPPSMPGFTGLEGYPFEPERARQILQEAGYTDPLQLTFSASGYDDLGSLATAVIAMWQEHLGVEIRGELVEPYLYTNKLYRGDIGNLFNLGWCADYADPENFLDLLFHSESQQNLGGYQNATVDDLLEQARIEPNVMARMAQYAQIEQQLVDDAATVFVGHSFWHTLVSSRINGYTFTPIGVPQWHLVTLDN